MKEYDGVYFINFQPLVLSTKKVVVLKQQLMATLQHELMIIDLYFLLITIEWENFLSI